MKKRFKLFLCAVMVLVLSCGIYTSAEELAANRALSGSNFSTITTISDFSRFASDYGYKDLGTKSNGANRQKLYKKILDAATNFWNSSGNLTANGGQYVISTVDCSGLSLTQDEMVETLTAFKVDNPIFYFFSNTISCSSNSLILLADPAYANASVRNSCKSKIIAGLNEVGPIMNGKTSEFDLAVHIYDKVMEKIEYAYKSDGVTPETSVWAHNIMGYFDSTYNKGVCECYAEVLHLIYNMVGIDSYYVTGLGNGENHAWNMIKLDDNKYYYLDATWDDGTGGYEWFAEGKGFETSHVKNLSTATSINYIPAVPEVASADFKLTKTFSIDSVSDIKKIEIDPTGTYNLAANIDASSLVGYYSESEVDLSVSGISAYCMDIEFAGKLDGKGYTISNLRAALFRQITSTGTVTNCKFVTDYSTSKWNNTRISAPQFHYALARINRGTISDCNINYTFSDNRDLQLTSCTGLVYENRGTITNADATINVVGYSSPRTSIAFLRLSGVAGENYGNITGSDITFNIKENGKNNTPESYASIIMIGGVVFEVQGGTVKNCTAKGTIQVYEGRVISGGCIAYACISDGTIEFCTNNATVDCATSSYTAGFGGIVAETSGIIKNCINNANIYNHLQKDQKGAVGGIASDMNCTAGKIENCINNGNINTEMGYAGGIVGQLTEYAYIKGCENYGDITGKRVANTSSAPRAGGLIGDANFSAYADGQTIRKGTLYIIDCKNEGDVWGHAWAGCITSSITVGNNATRVYISGTTNSGKVKTGSSGSNISQVKWSAYNPLTYFGVTVTEAEVVSITNCDFEQEKSNETTTQEQTTEVVTTTKPQQTTTQPETTPGQQTTTQPGTTPGQQTTTQPGTTPGQQTTTQPGTTPGQQTTTQPETTPGQQTTTQPGTTPGQQTTTQPGTTPGQQTTTQPGTTPGQQATTQPETTSSKESGNITEPSGDDETTSVKGSEEETTFLVDSTTSGNKNDKDNNENNENKGDNETDGNIAVYAVIAVVAVLGIGGAVAGYTLVSKKRK